MKREMLNKNKNATAKIFTLISIKIVLSYRSITNLKILFDKTINIQDNYNELINDLYLESKKISEYYLEG